MRRRHDDPNPERELIIMICAVCVAALGASAIALTMMS